MITLSNAKRYLGLSDRAVSIVGNGTLATATLESHDYKTGDQVEIAGTTNFNGVKTVTRISADKFSFANSSATTESGLVLRYDFVLSKMIAGTRSYIEKYTSCKWEESVTESEKIIDCPEDGIVFVPKMPLASVASISIAPDRNFNNETSLSSTDYLVYPEEGRVELLGEKSSAAFGHRKSLKISYSTGTLPEGIELAAYELLAFYFRTWNDKAQNVTSRSSQGDQIFFSKEVPQSIKEMLDPYQRISIGGSPRSPRPLYF